MKVTIRRSDAGKLMAYILKKDLEEEIVEQIEDNNGEILVLANGFRLLSNRRMADLKVPITLELKKLND